MMITVKNVGHDCIDERDRHHAARRCLMSALGFGFSFVACLLVAGQLLFMSGQTYAAEKKSSKQKATPSTSALAMDMSKRQCCWPGAICPTPKTEGSPGCRCCGFRLDGKLGDYNPKTRAGWLELAGLSDRVPFLVTKDTVHDKLQQIGKDGNGQFTLKTQPFPNQMESPTGFGMGLECLDTGDTTLKDRTADFVAGATISAKIFEVTEALLNAIPTYAPELKDDQ
jgi:hypothetical protein